jgi:hypothetical protein
MRTGRLAPHVPRSSAAVNPSPMSIGNARKGARRLGDRQPSLMNAGEGCPGPKPRRGEGGLSLSACELRLGTPADLQIPDVAPAGGMHDSRFVYVLASTVDPERHYVTVATTCPRSNVCPLGQTTTGTTPVDKAQVRKSSHARLVLELEGHPLLRSAPEASERRDRRRRCSSAGSCQNLRKSQRQAHTWRQPHSQGPVLNMGRATRRIEAPTFTP